MGKRFLQRFFSPANKELQLGDSAGLDWVPLENGSSMSADSAVNAGSDKVAGCELTGAFFEKVVLGLSDASFAEQLESKLDMAVSKWHCVLSYCLLASTTGRQIASAGDDATIGSSARRIIRAVIGTRSPNTAISRASSLLRFLIWCASEYPNTENPFYEELAWRFVCALQDGQSAATTGATFLSACRYAHHIFGFQLDTIIGSRRLAGVAEILYQDKRHLKQARVLTVQNVKRLREQVTDDSLADFDRAMFGYILVCVYGRCRHSDLSCVEDVTIDVGEDIGFCEIRTSFHKTSRAAAQKATLLPIVMPALGVHGRLWPEEVKAAFERVGLAFSGKIRGSLLRPPKRAVHQGLCQRGITSSEITRLLRMCFDQHVPADAADAERVSSHSLKATALSWAAKFGVDPRTQSLLGRHSSLAREASAVYCRDTAIRATSSLCEVIAAINEGRFFPDAPRSLYRVAPSSDAQSSQPVIATDEVKHEGSSGVKSEGGGALPFVDLSADEPMMVHGLSSEESSSSLDSDSDSSVELPKAKIPKIKDGSIHRFFKHRTSGYVHYVDPVMDSCASKTFGCGKLLSANFAPTLDRVECHMNAI